MADKKRKPYPEKARERIKCGMVLRKLADHVEGKVDMTSTQVQAARILLAKVLPDLQQVDGNINHQAAHYVISAKPEMSTDEWLIEAEAQKRLAEKQKDVPLIEAQDEEAA